MSADTLARAVDPFFTTKGLGKGTGLGLSMVHGFANQSGGRLVPASEPGRGTTAEIWLPAAEPVAPNTAPPPVEAMPDTAPLRVLVVDDDSLVLTNTAALLEDLGHEVVEATSGQQALHVLRRDRDIGLVITDQLMPSRSSSRPATPSCRPGSWPRLPG
jgi:hypothetical protein